MAKMTRKQEEAMIKKLFEEKTALIEGNKNIETQIAACKKERNEQISR